MRWRLGQFAATPFFTRSKNHTDQNSTSALVVEHNRQRCGDSTTPPSIIGDSRQQVDPSSTVAVSTTPIAAVATEGVGINSRRAIPCRGSREVWDDTQENDSVGGRLRRPQGDDLSMSVSCSATRPRRSLSSAVAGNGDVAVGTCHDSAFGAGSADGCTCTSGCYVAESSSDRGEWRQVQEDDGGVCCSTSHGNASSRRANDCGRDNTTTGFGAEEVANVVVPDREQQQTTRGGEEERSITTPTALVAAAPTGLPQEGDAGKVQAKENDHKQVVAAELRHYFLERGGGGGGDFRVDEQPCRASGAASVCLALLLRATASPDEANTTQYTASTPTSAATAAGPADLLALASLHLSLSGDASTHLFAWLTDNGFTASRLASTIGHDFASSSSLPALRLLAAGPSAESGAVAVEGTSPLASHQAEVAGKAEAAMAAAALTEACRAWGHIANAMKSSACVTVKAINGGVGGVDGGGDDDGTLRDTGGAIASVGEKGGQHNKHLVGPRLRQAIRSVTTGAAHCYGQLVVLGYKVS